MAEIAGSGS